MSDPFIPNSYYCYHVDSSTGRKYLRYFINETQYIIDCYIEPDGRRIKTWGAGENVSPKQGQWLPSMERFESSQEGDWDNARDTPNAKSEGNFDPDPDNTQPSARTEQSSIATIEHPRAALSLQWYVNSHQGARRLNNQITPLINGQNTFGAVAKAIKEAKQTIEIITWGFDASLRLERPNGKRIGELLEEKGKEGVKVKLLVWRNPLTQVMENTVPGINEKTNTSTIKDAVVWAKHKILPPKITPSPEQLQAEKELLDAKKKHRLLKFDYLTSKASEWINPFDNSDSSSSDQKKRELDELEAKIKRLEQQYAHAQTLPVTTEQVDYGQGMVEKLINSAGAPGDPDSLLFNRDWHHRMSEGEIENVDFRVRDYTSDERSAIALNNIWENVLKKYQPTPALQLFLLSAFPSHHQKTVVVDYEQPKDAIGFVMGHNMHNNYWDTSAHDYEDAKGLRVRGFGPWQDLSCQVKGAVLHDLNRNFCAAWDRGSSWYRRWFDSISDARKSLTPNVFASQDGGMRTVAQITRTQFQEGKERSIRESYMQAMGNARDCIYIENQYFRYKPLAQRLKQTRLQLLSGGKDEAAHGTCHVFIITNVTDDHGRTNTYDMLEALGRSDRMPTVHRDTTDPDGQVSNDLTPQDIAGLKVHIATLVSGTKKPGNQNQYRPIYVHSKLLVVDDVFFTLGSANINQRSMEVDSELNIASADPDLAKQWREQLFTLHTGRSPNIDAENEFDIWTRIMKENQIKMKEGLSLTGHLIEFFDNGPRTQAFD